MGMSMNLLGLSWYEILMQLQCNLLESIPSPITGELEFSNLLFFNHDGLVEVSKNSEAIKSFPHFHCAQNISISTSDCVQIVKSFERSELCRFDHSAFEALCIGLCLLSNEQFEEGRLQDFKGMLIRVGLFAQNLQSHFASIKAIEISACEDAETINVNLHSNAFDVDEACKIAERIFIEYQQNEIPYHEVMTMVIKAHLDEEIILELQRDELQIYENNTGTPHGIT